MSDDRGAKIREARQAKGMTQAELAEAVGASARTVARWENSVLAPNDNALGMLRIVLESDL